jgi:hypothetical protein
MAKLSSGTAQGMGPDAFNEYYRQKMQERLASDASAYGQQPVQDLSGPTPESVIGVGAGKVTPEQFQAAQAPVAGNDKAALAGALTTTGMATAQPELVAAGLALQTAGMIQQGKTNQANAKYTAEVNKINARQNAIDKMSQIGQGLRA